MAAHTHPSVPRTHPRVLSRLQPRLRDHRGALLVTGILIVLASGIGLAFPLVVRDILDAAFVTADGGLLNRIALLLVLLFAIQAVLNFGQSYLMSAVSERITASLRSDVFRHLIQQPPGYFARARVGDLSSRIASDAGLLQQVLRFGIPELIRQSIFLLGALVLLTVTHPRLTLVTFIAIPPTLVAGWLLGRRVRRISGAIQDHLADAVARAEQVFTQITTVQSFTRESWEIDRFEADMAATRDGGIERGVARAWLAGVVTFTGFGAVALVVWEGGRLVLEGLLTPGTLVAFLVYWILIAGAVTSLAGFWGNLQEAAGAAGRIFQLLDEPIERVDPARPVSLPTPLVGRVAFEGVSFRYRPDLPWVLNDIDLVIEPGERVALVGVSGAGKSTLASLISRFHDPEEGRVLMDGIDVRRLRLADLRRAVGLVPQEPMLFAGTLDENLRYGNPEVSQDAVEQAARDARAHEFIVALPGAYGAHVGERGVTLSAGQRQRMAIARVLLKAPAVLILDEASSALDAASERRVQDALDRLMAGRTTLVIAHRFSTIVRADRIVVLEGGRIVASGTHTDLLASSPAYARLVQLQFETANPAAVR